MSWFVIRHERSSGCRWLSSWPATGTSPWNRNRNTTNLLNLLDGERKCAIAKWLLQTSICHLRWYIRCKSIALGFLPRYPLSAMAYNSIETYPYKRIERINKAGRCSRCARWLRCSHFRPSDQARTVRTVSRASEFSRLVLSKPGALSLQVSTMRSHTKSCRSQPEACQGRHGNWDPLSQRKGSPRSTRESSSCGLELGMRQLWIFRCIWIDLGWSQQQLCMTTRWRTEKFKHDKKIRMSCPCWSSQQQRELWFKSYTTSSSQ